MGFREVLAVAVLLGALAACGDDDPSSTAADPATDPGSSSAPVSQPAESTGTDGASPSDSATSSEPAPACADLWVDGQTIPRRYLGCDDESGTFVPVDKTRCESGQILVVYGDQFYGVLGNRVNDVGGPLSESSTYRRAARSCG